MVDRGAGRHCRGRRRAHGRQPLWTVLRWRNARMAGLHRCRVSRRSRDGVQAEAELAGTGVELMKMTGGQQSAPHVDWLAQNVPAGETVGVDGAVLGVTAARALTAALSARGIALRTDLDLLDAIWPERPGLPGEAVFEHLAPQADTTRASKLAEVRRAMQAQGAQWHFVSTLDDLAWLFNLRGAD